MANSSLASRDVVWARAVWRSSRWETCLQQLVTGIVTERIVDLAEAIQVNHDQNQSGVVLGRLFYRFMEPGLEERAVGETG